MEEIKNQNQNNNQGVQGGGRRRRRKRHKNGNRQNQNQAQNVVQNQAAQATEQNAQPAKQNAPKQNQSQNAKKQKPPKNNGGNNNNSNNNANKQNEKSKRKDTYLYALDGNLYVNLTNKCSNGCDFCVRNERESYYGHYLMLYFNVQFLEIRYNFRNIIQVKQVFVSIVFEHKIGQPSATAGSPLCFFDVTQ